MLPQTPIQTLQVSYLNEIVSKKLPPIISILLMMISNMTRLTPFKTALILFKNNITIIMPDLLFQDDFDLSRSNQLNEATLTPQVQHLEIYKPRVESSTRVFFLVYYLLNLLSLLYLVL